MGNDIQLAADELKWNRLVVRRAELGLTAAFRFFRAHCIEPILIKGWAAARNYPEDRPRGFGDLDLAVAADDFGQAERLINEPDFPRVGIDLHRELRHLDSVPWQILFDRSELIDIDGVPIRVLRTEDHLRVMAVHWLNDGAAYKERLWDIYYAVTNRPAEFDWEICLDSASPTRRRWVTTTIVAAHEYLGLDISEVPLRAEELQLPRWFVRTIEREWASDVRLRPLHTCVRQPRALLQQLRKRFPPNPIQATIETEGEFDDTPRVIYQTKDVFQRIPSSAARIVNVLLRRPWK